ncbi:GbsR/MarR family transcriptional regulator [Rhizobacter sp. OV335]|uniref:GbsR/MarR family transcriptional regulator n=1 Tax=Rhizobacter sp. OV335 TaxID=1500264 RepID=UPI000918D65B|nr:MarR family transcriptional regulator [Rhizobacter sp. OV335]SHM39146.1 DNA-binding transcriptional regulator GbsR, MarR family [Rhizobacter sp. OV335]
MNLSPTLSRFVLHWGEMGTRWGVNRTVAQIHALLFITGRPMHAEEIADTLDVARSNVSNSLRELQGWNLIKLVHLAGDRRDHFETSTQVWELLRTVVRERQRREIAPTIEVLNELLADPALSRDPAEARLRIRETQELLVTLTAWSDEMLKLDTDTLTKVLKLGAKIKKLLGRDGAAAPEEINPAQLLGP